MKDNVTKRYNRLMNYSINHTPGQFTKKELEAKQRENELYKARLKAQEQKA